MARRFNTTLEKVKAVIARYDLFEMDGDEFFYSVSLMARMQVLEDNRRRRQIAGQKGGNAKAMLKHSHSKHVGVEERRIEERKVDESRGEDQKRKRFVPPSIDEVILEMDNEVEAHKYHDYYTSKGWMVGKSPMKDWKASVRNWKRTMRENKTKVLTRTPHLDTIDNKPF